VVASFKSELKRLRPDVEFVSEQWPPLGKLDGGSLVQAVASSARRQIGRVCGDFGHFFLRVWSPQTPACLSGHFGALSLHPKTPFPAALDAERNPSVLSTRNSDP
jgi:hypothetical protein